ncbi:MAG: oligosaccharide flippase family protein [Bacilli bacterium]|nr:oligosaccharide flippase family protein [Bacilli bacterium]
MRTSNSIRNSFSATLQTLVTMIVGFIAQTIFIRLLGAEYLGLNGLFTNILSMLSIFELGIGNAIVYNLYKPIADNDIGKIKSLMRFYKKAYNIIAILVLVFGLVIVPFLPLFVKNVTVDINITIVYILFLMSSVASYVLTYKRSLIYANQKNYIINYLHAGYIVILNVLQLLVLYLFKNYYIYLLLKIVCQLLENIILNVIANKMYPYLKDNDASKLDKKTEKSIFKKIKALFFHKVGSYIVLGTDNLIISTFIGIVVVGYYSNYYMVINAVNTFGFQIITSAVASIGNLLVTENAEKTYSVFKKIRFLNFWIACFSAICILNLMQPFIRLWAGSKYLLSTAVLIVLVFNYYQKMMRRSYAAFKDASGTWEEDKYVPIVESILNVVFSIVFLKMFGLVGVFVGTIVSGFAVWCYSYPKFVYKKLFKRSYLDYSKETIAYILTFVLLATITYLCTKLFIFNNQYIQLGINLTICLIVPNLLMLIIFRKTDNYKYFASLLKKIFDKFRKKLRKS